jgi:hypothetical protein
MPVSPLENTVTENTTTVAMEVPDFDALLAEAQATFAEKNRPKYSMPQVLGDYRKVDGKPGLYARPMCLELELRALELYEIFANGTASGLARIGAELAADVLYRLRLPFEETEAKERIHGYLKGEVPEDEIFVPLTSREVGRIFRDTEELSNLVLNPLGLRVLGNEEEQGPEGNE